MVRSLPNLVAARAFETFARTGSVRSAADDLAISHTVVSRHIQNLEYATGRKLVKKLGRGLILTPEGQRFSTQLQRAFDLISKATAELALGNSGPLHVCCMAGFASRCLLPRLPELEAELGGRNVILQPTTSLSDFSSGEVDADIFYFDNPSLPTGLCSEIISRPRILALASPTFKGRYPRVKSAADLISLPLIHERSTRQWEEWFERAGVSESPKPAGPRLWHAHLTIEAVRLGQGVALVSELLVQKELAAGELVEMVEVDVRLGAYYLIAPLVRWNDASITSLRKWLITHFADHPTS
jgi:LysR family transcriptional regulator, glycine cleavage system transcriptional activator